MLNKNIILFSCRNLVFIKRTLILLSILMLFVSVSHADIYLSSYAVFFCLPLVVSVSALFLVSCGRLKFSLLDIVCTIILIIVIARLIIEGTFLLYYYSFAKTTMLFLFFFVLRNLCVGDYRFLNKSMIIVFSFWIFVQVIKFIFFFIGFEADVDFIYSHYYNNVIYPILFMLIVICVVPNYWSQKNLGLRILAFVLLILCGIIAFYFESRTSILIGLVAVLYLFFSKYQIKNKYIIGILFLICAILLLAFLFKVDSSYGRMQIWKNTLYLISDNFFQGIGVGKFSSLYMDYQVMSSILGRMNDYEMLLIGNTNFAYNDIMEFFCKFGAVLSITFVVAFLITYNRLILSKCKLSVCSFVLLLVLLSSLFNYLAQVLYVQIFIIILLVALRQRYIRVSVRKYSQILMLFICCICLSVCIISGLKYGEYREFIVRANLTSVMNADSLESNLVFLSDNPNYLSFKIDCNYKYRRYPSVVDNVNDLFCYVKSDYYELIRGRSYAAIGQLEKAEESLLKSVAMYPSRYKNKFELMIFYKDVLNDSKKALRVAKEIVRMKEKIPSGLSYYITQTAELYVTECEKK